MNPKACRYTLLGNDKQYLLSAEVPAVAGVRKDKKSVTFIICSFAIILTFCYELVNNCIRLRVENWYINNRDSKAVLRRIYLTITVGSVVNGAYRH